MIEIGIIVGVIALVIGVTALFALVSWWVLFGSGIALIVFGMLLGIPTGFWFHVVLYRVMKKRGIVVKRWWLRPVGIYESLAREDRRRVAPWLYLGGAGFAFALMGCALFAVGALRS
jgi:hypothetical protein